VGGVEPLGPTIKMFNKGHIDPHVSFTNIQVMGRLVIGQWRPIDMSILWRRLVY